MKNIEQLELMIKAGYDPSLTHPHCFENFSYTTLFKLMSQQSCCVFQEWMFNLSMQQQSVLILACRGPDGIPKFHHTKGIVRYYRATVLKSAVKGRAMKPGEDEGGWFATLDLFQYDEGWYRQTSRFFDHVDELPHHYYMHLMHGAEIIAYHHPDDLFRRRWGEFYADCCKDLHLTPESKEEMDHRLCDFNRKGWNNEEDPNTSLATLRDPGC